MLRNKLSAALPLLTALSLAPLAGGCGMAAQRDAQAKLAEAPAPAQQVLGKSLYAKNKGGGLSEEQLQKILESPIDLQFPARVGVVPLAAPFDPEENPTLRIRTTAAGSFATALDGASQFSHISDVSTELPHVGGIEGLRVLAARYRLRYLLLYSERFENATHANGWAWLYPTVLGIFLSPGITVESDGIAQVDLLDVRTGPVLFSVMEPMHVSSQQLAIPSARAHDEKKAEAAGEAAKTLAKRVALQAKQLVAYAESFEQHGYEARTRILPSPIAPEETVQARVKKLATGGPLGSAQNGSQGTGTAARASLTDSEK